MATEDTEQQSSPFTRPGFIAAAVVVALIVVLGIVIGVVNATRDDPEPGGSPSPAPTPTTATSEPTQAAGEESVCGLDGAETGPARLTSAPPVDEWAYQGTTAYPVSREFGPGATDDSAGFRYCFQHTPEGALFAAANAAVQGADPDTVGPWLEYFLAEGPHRDAVLAAGQGAAGDNSGVRVDLAGFRVLAYEGNTARVDIALRGAAQGQTVNLSMVYDLVWEDGDWKLTVTDPNAPIDVANLPDLSGYIAWGE